MLCDVVLGLRQVFPAQWLSEPEAAEVALDVQVILTPVYFISNYPYKIYRGASE